MPRKTEESRVVRAVQKYLALAENGPPAEYPLDVRSVARKTKTSPTTLYKYGLQDLIKKASDQQKKNSVASATELENKAYLERLRAVCRALEEERERNRGLVAHIALLEANAVRLGIDPEDLRQPIAKPDRRISRAGKAQPTGITGTKKRT